MSKAFPDPGKGFPKALASLRAAVQGGGVLDSEPLNTGASPVTLDTSIYKHLVTTSGTAGNEFVELPSAAEIGSRVLIVFDVEGNAADVVRIVDDAVSSIQSGGIVGDTPAAIATIDLDTPGEFALLEYQGGDLWNLLYTDGVTA